MNRALWCMLTDNITLYDAQSIFNSWSSETCGCTPGLVQNFAILEQAGSNARVPCTSLSPLPDGHRGMASLMDWFCSFFSRVRSCEVVLPFTEGFGQQPHLHQQGLLRAGHDCTALDLFSQGGFPSFRAFSSLCLCSLPSVRINPASSASPMPAALPRWGEFPRLAPSPCGLAGNMDTVTHLLCCPTMCRRTIYPFYWARNRAEEGEKQTASFFFTRRMLVSFFPPPTHIVSSSPASRPAVISLSPPKGDPAEGSGVLQRHWDALWGCGWLCCHAQRMAG